MQTRQQKNSSISTILAMVNNMLGGSLLTFPILFRDSGFLSSFIVLALSAIISYVTCRMYVLHAAESDKDVESTMKRILGLKWEKFFRYISGFYLLLLSVISLDLIVDQLYSIIYFFFNYYGSPDSIAEKTQFEFQKFSTQWLTLILFFPLLATIFLKNLNFLVKLSEYGSISIFVYMIYVVIQFLVSAFSGEIILDNITWFSSDIGNLAGTCGLAFTMHTVVITFMKQNREQQNNQRDLRLVYIMGFALYLIVSVAGAFGISNKHCENTFIDCFLTDWTILFVEFTFLFGRLTVFPIMVQVGRTRILQLFYDEIDPKIFKIFNISFMIFGSIISIMSPKIPLSVLMAIVGSVVCYFFIYLIPTRLHYGCLYPQETRNVESLVESTIQNQVDNTQPQVPCNHPRSYAQEKPKIVRHVIYGTLNCIGIAIGVFGLYASINNIVNS